MEMVINDIKNLDATFNFSKAELKLFEDVKYESEIPQEYFDVQKDKIYKGVYKACIEDPFNPYNEYDIVYYKIKFFGLMRKAINKRIETRNLCDYVGKPIHGEKVS